MTIMYVCIFRPDLDVCGAEERVEGNHEHGALRYDVVVVGDVLGGQAHGTQSRHGPQPHALFDDALQVRQLRQVRRQQVPHVLGNDGMDLALDALLHFWVAGHFHHDPRLANTTHTRT